MYATLADILLRNLLKNAIKYTPANGTVLIRLSQQEFSISNTGDPLGIPLKKSSSVSEKTTNPRTRWG